MESDTEGKVFQVFKVTNEANTYGAIKGQSAESLSR